MELSKEQKILLLLARFPYDEKTNNEVKETFENNSIDWDLFFKIAIEQKISMIIFHRLQNFIDFIPNGKIEDFKQKCTNQLRNNLLNTKELLRICDEAEKYNLDIIPYKGAVFADEVYGGINLRASSDIDFWYPFNKTPVLKELVKENEYKPLIDYNAIQGFFFTKINCEFHFYKRFKNYNQRVLIEPHHYLIKHFLKVNPTEEDLIKYTKKQKILNREIKVFSPELTILYLVLHHGSTENWGFFKHYVDLAAYINRYFDELDWDELLGICEKYEIKKTFLVGVHITKYLLKIDLPNVLELESNKKEIETLAQLCLNNSWNYFNNESKRPFFKIYFLWKTRGSFIQKIKLIWQIIEYSFLRLLFFLSLKLT
jgi:hypothetical protein